VFGLPLVVRAVDQPGAHHGHGQVAECRYDPQLEARGARIVGGRRIDAACPAIADVLEEGRERLTGVDTGTRRRLHPLDPTFGLVERRMGALGALTPLADRVRPSHPSPVRRFVGTVVQPRPTPRHREHPGQAQLVAIGIKPYENRKATLFQLAGDIPAPVLAELIGISNDNAADWARLPARDWSGYIADRAR